MQSWAYGWRLKNLALGSEVCIYTYPGGTPSVAELSSSSDVAGGAPGQGGTHSIGGAAVSMCPQCVCRFFVVPFWQGRQLSVWCSRTIAWCLSIAAFTWLCPGNSTPCIFSCQTSAWGFLISCCVSSIVVRENPPLAIWAIFKARHMSDYSSCTWPPCLSIVADMLKTYKKLVAGSKVRFGCYLNLIRVRSLF